MTRGPQILEELGPDLDDLHAATRAPVMARRPWLETWIRCYPDHEPWAVVVENAGGLAGAALLARRKRFGITEIVRLGHGATDHARLPARDPQAAEALAEAVTTVLQEMAGPWMLFLGQLPESDAVARGIVRRLRWAAARPGDGSPRIRFGPERSPNAYLSRSDRGNVRWMLNRLRKAGLDSAFRVIRDPEGIADVLPETERVRRERDGELERYCKLDDPRYLSFRRAVIVELAEQGEAEIATLRIGSELAAYMVSLLDASAYRDWDSRISPRLGRYRPGQLMHASVIDRVLEDPRYEEFDFMRGTQEYKLRLATDVVPAETIVAWSSPLVKGMDRSARLLKRARKSGTRLLRAPKKMVRGASR